MRMGGPICAPVWLQSERLKLIAVVMGKGKLVDHGVRALLREPGGTMGVRVSTQISRS